MTCAASFCAVPLHAGHHKDVQTMASVFVLWLQLGDDTQHPVEEFPPPQMQQQIVLQLLLAGILLPYLADQSPECCDENLLSFCPVLGNTKSVAAAAAGSSGAISMSELSELYDLFHFGAEGVCRRMADCAIESDVWHKKQRQGQMQPGQGRSVDSRPRPTLQCMQPFKSTGQLMGFVADWLHCGALRALLDIMSNLLQLARPGTAAAATAGTTPAAASSSSSGDNVCDAAVGEKDVLQLVGSYLQMLSVVAGGLVYTVGEDPSATALAPVWLHEGVAGRLAVVTERYVRLFTATITAAGEAGEQVPALGSEKYQLCGWHWVSGLCAGPGSVLQLVSEQQPPGGVFERSFLSCLCSLLRLADSDARVIDAPSMQEVCSSVMYSAVAMVERSVFTDQDVLLQAAEAAAAARAGGGAGCGEVLLGLEQLPALVLFGRCCVLLADAWEGVDVAAGLSPDQAGFAKAFFGEMDVCSHCDIVARWLSEFSWHLGHAGYPCQAMQQSFEALGEAITTSPLPWVVSAAGPPRGAGAEMAAAAVAKLVECLRAVGVAAAAIPVPHFCNNSRCGNVSGVSEVLMVTGHSCICSGCHTARYCGRACQRQAWKQHKPVCKALAAAAQDHLGMKC
jgi:hypothetical protein